MDPTHCPECSADFQGEPIKPESQHLFGSTHFSRVIGIYDMWKDRTVSWRCPDCSHEWPR